MSNLAQFAFQDNQVRVLVLENNPWFVALDVCKILDVNNISQALTRLKDYEKSTIITNDVTGRNQELLIISESGLYRLVLTSRKPDAEPFQDWVCQEVLPQIRKTGKYESQPTLNIYARRVQIASKWDIPIGYWCVFHEISLLANKVGETYQVGEYDLIDGSVGKCWNNYRKAFEWIQPTILFPVFFGDSRDAAHVEVKGYKNSELPHFRDWLETVYKMERLPKYLTGKYGQLMKRK
jgi:prophage antirepressor-like protein